MCLQSIFHRRVLRDLRLLRLLLQWWSLQPKLEPWRPRGDHLRLPSRFHWTSLRGGEGGVRPEVQEQRHLPSVWRASMQSTLHWAKVRCMSRAAVWPWPLCAGPFHKATPLHLPPWRLQPSLRGAAHLPGFPLPAQQYMPSAVRPARVPLS